MLLVNPPTVNKTITSSVCETGDHTDVMDSSAIEIAHVYHWLHETVCPLSRLHRTLHLQISNSTINHPEIDPVNMHDSEITVHPQVFPFAPSYAPPLY